MEVVTVGSKERLSGGFGNKMLPVQCQAVKLKLRTRTRTWSWTGTGTGTTHEKYLWSN